MADFFVSYTSADRAWAEWAAFVLEEEGFSVSIQAWDFRPGSNFVLEMQKAAHEADRTVMVLSPNYIKSQFASSEWAAAFASDPEGLNRKLVPVMVRRCQPPGLLAQVVYIDLVDLNEAAARETLMTGVRNRRAKPQVRPLFPGRTESPAHGTFPGAQAATARPQPYRPKVGRKPTDADKRRFVKDAFATIKDHFEAGLSDLQQGRDIECDFQLVTATEFTAEVFVSGNSSCRCHVWQGGMSGDGVSYAEGQGHFNHSTTHEILSLEDRDGELRLSAMMGTMFARTGGYDSKSVSAEEAADYLWRRFVAPLEHRR